VLISRLFFSNISSIERYFSKPTLHD
jgi:hypothetical protein